MIIIYNRKAGLETFGFGFAHFSFHKANVCTRLLSPTTGLYDLLTQTALYDLTALDIIAFDCCDFITSSNLPSPSHHCYQFESQEVNALSSYWRMMPMVLCK